MLTQRSPSAPTAHAQAFCYNISCQGHPPQFYRQSSSLGAAPCRKPPFHLAPHRSVCAQSYRVSGLLISCQRTKEYKQLDPWAFLLLNPWRRQHFFRHPEDRWRASLEKVERGILSSPFIPLTTAVHLTTPNSIA